MPGVYSIREHETFRLNDRLRARDLEDLKAFAQANQYDQQGNYRPVLQFDRRGGLRAANYVGIITTKRGTIVEVLPKIDLLGNGEPNDEETRSIFLQMLRTSRRLQAAARFQNSAIRAMRRFPMLDGFVRLFLDNLGLLVRGGLSRRYVRVQENLPYLRGRILFRDQIRENLIDRARFFVEHDELSINRPANRLIHSTLAKLKPVVRNEGNRQLLRNLEAAFVEVPPARDLRGDWRKHSVDRSMQHYKPVMRGRPLPVQPGPDHLVRQPCESIAAVSHGGGLRGLCHPQFSAPSGQVYDDFPGSAKTHGLHRRQVRVPDEAGYFAP